MHHDPSLPFTLVMLHGLLGDRDDWQALGEALEQVLPGVRCLALNLPGHGQPTTPAVGSFADFHDWLSGTLAEARPVMKAMPSTASAAKSHSDTSGSKAMSTAPSATKQ